MTLKIKTTTKSKRKKTMKTMKTMYRVVLTAITVALLMTSIPAPVSANDTDARIESAAKDSYVFRKYLKEDAIQIESKDGAVTLTGTVAEESHQSMAQETVASLPGVKSVDNRLALKGESVAEKSDLWVSMKVKTTLLLHRNVNLMTEVDTKDGIVTLQGEAKNQAQKDLTTEYVKDVEGVKDVQNEMTISTNPDEKTMGEKIEAVGESIDDASITALVKMTLLYHRSTSAVHTKVETANGVVTLEGTARNAAEIDLVSKYVQDVHGVQSVVNNITIKPLETK